MYSHDTKVLHLGNVANTGVNLVAAAQEQGRMWALRNLPATPSLTDLRGWGQRLKDAADYGAGRIQPDLQHIHYGPNGYYGFLKRSPYVLHLHGTDLRQDLHRPLIGQVERLAIKQADAIVVATPDLLEAAQELDPEAIYVPNPLPVHSFVAAQQIVDAPAESERQSPTVFFSARWDDSKGGEDLVDFASALIDEGVEVKGVDWGQYADKAMAAGVKLLPMLSPQAFQSQLAQADAIVGQFSFGALGIADLQALATGQPFIAHVNSDLEPGIPIGDLDIEHALNKTRQLLDNPEEAEAWGKAGQQWVLQNRSPQRAIEDLEAIYRRVLA